MSAASKLAPSHPALDLSLIPPPTLRLLHHVSAAAAALGIPAYLVGGFVRDLLIKRPVKDFDVVVEGDGIRLARSLARMHGGKVTAHPKFGTATWTPPPELVTDAHPSHHPDFAAARTEIYRHPGALPEVEYSDIKEDLRRRDFSFNAMALRLDGGEIKDLLDPFRGRADLERGLIRALHARSFVDDPTRMFRAIRYANRYGFEIAPATQRLFNDEARQVLSRLSGERLRHEFDLILDEQNSASMLADASHLGLLSAVDAGLPRFELELAGLRDSAPAPTLGVEADRRTLGYLLWLMGVPKQDLLRLRERLAFKAGLAKAVLAASALWRDMPVLVGTLPSRWASRLEDVPATAIYAVYLQSGEPTLAAYLERWRHIRPFTTGEDLKRRGLVAGPRFKEVLSRLRAAWIDGEVTSQGDEAALLERLLKGSPGTQAK